MQLLNKFMFTGKSGIMIIADNTSDFNSIFNKNNIN